MHHGKLGETTPSTWEALLHSFGRRWQRLARVSAVVMKRAGGSIGLMKHTYVSARWQHDTEIRHAEKREGSIRLGDFAFLALSSPCLELLTNGECDWWLRTGPDLETGTGAFVFISLTVLISTWVVGVGEGVTIPVKKSFVGNRPTLPL